MRQQIVKLLGHTELLLDLYLGLRRKYAFLDPMLFRKRVIAKYGAGGRSDGFNVIKYSLLLTCIQDAAKIALDTDKRTPSVQNILEDLADHNTRNHFRAEFSVWNLPIPAETTVEVRAALERMEKQEQDKRAKDFDRIYGALTRRWSVLKDSKTLRSFAILRDKFTAHSEVHFDGAKYNFLDIGSLSLKWNDLSRVIRSLQRIVLDINLLVRNASFSYESYDKSLSKTANAFWTTKSA